MMTAAEVDNSPRRTRHIDDVDDDNADGDAADDAEVAAGSEGSDCPASENNDRNSNSNSNSNSNKRRRLDQRFLPGAIMCVRLKNFVTYTAAEFFPGPNMNLVIGPNGSGKSTIVCAICLGLGYKPDVLGRAAQIGEFVQHGKDAAEIEIELAQTDGKSVVVKRKLKRDKNQSQYWINGRQSTHAKVQELMSEFNIQCDNLCQFLPQDKVASFAAITPVELLQETQRAVGGEEMVNHWKRLIKLRGEERAFQLKFDNDKSLLQQLNKRQEADKIHVDRYRQQENLTSQIEQLKIRIPFARYRIALNLQKDRKTARDNMRETVRELMARDAPMHARVEAYKARKAEFDRQKEARTKAFERVVKAAGDQGVDAEKFTERAAEQRNELMTIRKAKQARLKDITDKKKDLEKKKFALQKREEEVANLPANWREDVQAEMNEATEKRREARDAFHKAERMVNNSKSDLAGLEEQYRERQGELNNLSSTLNQRLRALGRDQQETDTARVADWLENHGGKTRFKGTVHLPPALTVGVTDPRYAHLAESCFQRADLMPFTCSSQEDYVLFGHLVLDNKEGIFDKRQMVHVVENSGGKKLADWRSPATKQELAQFGFDFYLKDILTGPDEVLNTLCHRNFIYAIPLATRELDTNVHERLTTMNDPNEPDKLLFGRYVSGRTRYVLTREKYGNRNTVVHTSQWYNGSVFFTQQVDSQQTDKIKNKMRLLKTDMEDVNGRLSVERGQYEQAADEKQKAEELANILQAKKKQYSTVVQKREEALGAVQTAESAVRTAERKPDNSEEQIAKVLEEQKSDAGQRAEISIKMAELVKQGTKLMNDVVVAHIKAVQASADEVAMTAEAGNSSQELGVAKLQLGKLDADFRQAREQCRLIMEATQKLLLEKDKTVQDFAEIATNDTATVEELEDELENAQKTLELQQRHNVHGLIEAYEKRAKEIEEIQARMSDRNDEMERLSGEIAHHRKIWEPRLQRSIVRISDAFGEAFGSIGCAGEVALKRGDMEEPTDDFETWSIEIMVKFRETEKLQALTAQTQSGGERSVSTIFYLLALQELAKAPFRVVDEINQGMDPRNERLVHSRLVDAACRPNNSQYFLITPKLLPGLKYHRNMKVLTINNGKFIPGALDIASLIEQGYELQD